MRRTPSTRADSGAGAVEYVGALAVVAAVLGLAVLAASTTQVLPGAQALVCRALGGECAVAGGTAAPGGEGSGAAPPVYDDAAFVPPPCMLSETGEVGASQIKVAIFTFGDDYGFIERTFADGKVTMTAVNGATLGLIKSGDTKIVDIGRLDEETQVGGKLEVSGGLELKYGDTWSFDSADQAAAMRDQLDAYLLQQVAMEQNGAGMAISNQFEEWFGYGDGWVEAPKDAQVTYSTIGVEAALSGAFGLQEPLGEGADGSPTYLNPNVGIEAKVDGDYDVTVATNNETGERSYTYTLTGTGDVAGNLVVGEAGATGKTTGSFRITRDEQGQVTKLEMISTRQGDVRGQLEGRSPVSVAVGPSGSANEREGGLTVTEVELDVTTEEQRRIVQDWLSSNNEQLGTPLALTANGLVPSRANPDSPFETLLFEEASVSQVGYDRVQDTQKFGLDVKAGWELGLSVTLDSWAQNATAATYLGAPRPDGTRPVLMDGSCL